MKNKLKNLKIAILLCDGFEESEMTEPRAALINAGATVDLITSKQKKVRAWLHDKWSKSYKIDVALEDAKASDYDALLLPGGVLNPDKLRADKKAVKFVNSFISDQKLVAAICHGPMTLIETGQLDGVTMTSFHSIKTDLKNAGAKWVNKAVVIDKNFITSREPKDIPAFNKAIIKKLSMLV